MLLKRREKWFNELNQALTKYFNKEETKEIVSYYEEMIDDRLEQGEAIEHILNDYDAKHIARSMIPEMMSRRRDNDQKTTTNLWLIVLVLFSSPILIPLGVVYLSIMIAALTFLISGVTVMLSGVAAVFMQILRGFSLGLAFPEFIILIGVGLLALALCLFIGYYMVKVSWWFLQHLAIWFSKLIVRRRSSYEKN